MKKSMVFEGVATLLLILLIFIMYAMITGSAPVIKEQWNTTIGASPYLYAGDNGMLYVFTSNSITSISRDGNVNWNITIPDNRTMMDTDYNFGSMGGFRPATEPAIASYNGIMYVYTRPRLDVNESPVDLQNNITPVTSIMAISPDGKILWNTPMLSGTNGPPVQTVLISASNGKIYVYYHDLAVFSTEGSLLFKIDNIMAAPSMDEQGDIYAVKYDDNGTYDQINGYTGTFNTIVAYRPDGTLWWQKDMQEPLQDRYLDLTLNLADSRLPAYNNGTIYVPLKKSLVALDRNGSELWSTDFNGDIHMFLNMPFDPQNNVYLIENLLPIAGTDWVYYQGVRVAPNGSCSNYTIDQYYYTPIAVANGIGYYAYINNWRDEQTGNIKDPANLTDLLSQKVLAIDLNTGKNLWNFTVPTDNINELTLAPSNIYYLDEISSDTPADGIYYAPQSYSFPASADESIDYNTRHPELQSLNKSAIGPWKVAGTGTIKVLPGDNVVYVSYYMDNYEYPASLTSPPYDDGSDAYKYPHAAIFNRSELAYASGILALDNNGRLLWNKPMDSMVTTMAANNSTIFYGTENGKLSATQVNIAVGFALAAFLYLFLRFFCIGAVARAKARLNQNDNRNRVYEFIVKNPGSTLYETSRGTDMNIGTVRYHLFILGLNHKIVSSRMDGKYIRHFTNSNTYSKEEQFILSLVKRGTLGKILTILIGEARDLQRPDLQGTRHHRKRSKPLRGRAGGEGRGHESFGWKRPLICDRRVKKGRHSVSHQEITQLVNVVDQIFFTIFYENCGKSGIRLFL